VIVALLVEPVFVPTVKVTWPLAFPLVPDLMVTQVSELDADQAHPLGQDMLKLPLPPVALKVLPVADRA
jgi:hypothetical protein